MIRRRSQQLEWTDLGPSYYTPNEYHDYLYQLDRAGRFLGGDKATFSAFKKLKASPSSILDAGCGGGLFTIRLAARYPEATVVGIDISHEAIAFAKERLKLFQTSLPGVHFFVPPTPQLKDFHFPTSATKKNQFQQFDVVISTLVCHHLSDQELISFLQQACRMAKTRVILNDLHRHPLAMLGFAVLSPLLFRNRLFYHDGMLSIRRAFTSRDWKFYLGKAGIDMKYCTLRRHWPFRWLVTIDAAAIK